jgi:hypothetical protein
VGLLIEEGATEVFRADLAPGAMIANAAGTRFTYRAPSGAAGKPPAGARSDRHGTRWHVI